MTGRHHCFFDISIDMGLVGTFYSSYKVFISTIFIRDIHMVINDGCKNSITDLQVTLTQPIYFHIKDYSLLKHMEGNVP